MISGTTTFGKRRNGYANKGYISNSIKVSRRSHIIRFNNFGN